MIELLGSRQSDATKLIDTIQNLQETIKSTYQRKVHERVQGGVGGAGLFGSSFFETLGLSGVAENLKQSAEEKEKNRVAKEARVEEFQNSATGQILTGTTARQIAEQQFDNEKKLKQDAEATTTESEVEANQVEKQKIEVQTKMGDDLTDLYVITDDYFKESKDRMKKIEEVLIEIRDNGGMGGGLLDAASSAADMMGNRGGKAAGTAGKTAGNASKLAGLGRFAKVGGVLAVGTAAYDAYGDYSAADEAVKRGEITKEEGQVKKGEAVGGGLGAAGGALGGAKAGAMLGAFGGPVGMAIGGLLGGAAGYFGGKWLGEKAGGGAVSGAQALTGGPSAKVDEKVDAFQQKVDSGDMSPKQALDAIKTAEPDNKPLIQAAEAAFGSVAASPSNTSVAAQAIAPNTAGEINFRRTELANVENSSANNSQSSTVVAPSSTTIINNNGSSSDKKSSKNTESTFQKYVDRRYYPLGAH